MTPGVELLLAIAAQDPALLLTGQVLRDQGAMVTGMLASGWAPEHLRQVIAGRPLPVPVRSTVGAVIAGRLRAAAASPAPDSASHLPDHNSAPVAEDLTAARQLQTPTPPTWSQRKAALAAATAGHGPQKDCEGDGGLCRRLAVPGQALCGQCLGWELCPRCTKLRVTPHQEICDRCAESGGRSDHPAQEQPWVDEAQVVGHLRVAVDGMDRVHVTQGQLPQGQSWALDGDRLHKAGL